MVFNLSLLQMSRFDSQGFVWPSSARKCPVTGSAHSHSRNPEFSGAQFSINWPRLLRKRAGTGWYIVIMPGGRVMSSYSCWAAAAACKCHAAPRCCCCPEFLNFNIDTFAKPILLLQLSHFNLCQPGTADLTIHFFSVSKLGSGRSNQILKWETVQGVSLPAFYPNCTPKESHSSSIPKVIQNRVTLEVSGPH